LALSLEEIGLTAEFDGILTKEMRKKGHTAKSHFGFRADRTAKGLT
jgi:hypothetical protein